MSEHIIVGQFNSTIGVSAPGAKLTRLKIVNENGFLDHGIGNVLQMLQELNIFPTEVGLDLLVLATHVYAADTRISRISESQDSWTRELTLVVPVSNVQLWNSVRSLLVTQLNFLSGDIWQIQFIQRPSDYQKIINPPETTPVTAYYDTLSLFSGGLDSLVAAINLLEGNNVNPLFISHAGDSHTANAQHMCFDELKKAYPDRHFARIRLWQNISKELVDDVETEDSTRARSFLFFALGVFTATGINFQCGFTLLCPENGLIALNVPLDPLRLGSLSTRTTHPYYIDLWNKLLHGLSINGIIKNPYDAKTKGEMIRDCLNRQLLQSILPHSLSCSSAGKARWVNGEKHCGYCLPCLIRRAAVHFADGFQDNTPYTISNLAARTLDSEKATGEQIRSFQLAIKRLKDRPELADILIYKPGPLPVDPSYLPVLASVYKRGLFEVDSILSNVTVKPGG